MFGSIQSLVAFVLECDRYYWKAVCVKADQLEKTWKADIFGPKYQTYVENEGGRGLPVSVSPCVPVHR